MRLSIEQKVLEQIVNYLVAKPFIEVSKLMATLQEDIKPIEEQTGEEAKQD